MAPTLFCSLGADSGAIRRPSAGWHEENRTGDLLVGESIEAFVAKELDLIGFDLVELKRGGSRARPVLELRIDRRDGEKVTIDDCAQVSRALEARLEAGAMVGEQYVLEVSSPGADRPLRHAADWRRFVGRHAVVTSGLLAGGKQEVEILALNGEEGAEVALVRDGKGREVAVPLADVTQARLAFHWKR
ncbi:MAG: ribosome maturation factor RimP [Gemmatimonadaceae bacterium]|nr:ribosome maturation factor RimP [Gemmatimonadaceae bacterium]